MKRRAARPAPLNPRVEVQAFKTIGITEASVRLDHQPFMQLPNEDGARAIAELVSLALDIATRAGDIALQGQRTDETFVRSRVAYAVAKALGGSIDFESFAGREIRG